VKSYLWLGIQSYGFPEDDVGRSWWGIWTGIVAEAKVYSTPTGMEFRGGGSGGETRKAGGGAGEIRSDVCSI